MRTQTGWPGLKLEVEAQGEWIEVNAPEADPDWRYVDGAGHGHFWTDAHNKGTAKGTITGSPENFPTLKWVSIPCSQGHGDDCTSEGWWECPQCGEKITPGTRHVDRIWVNNGVACELELHDGGHTVIYRGFPRSTLDDLDKKIKALIRDALSDFATRMEFTARARR